jgi:hypothetical protein
MLDHWNKTIGLPRSHKTSNTIEFHPSDPNLVVTKETHYYDDIQRVRQDTIQNCGRQFKECRYGVKDFMGERMLNSYTGTVTKSVEDMSCVATQNIAIWDVSRGYKSLVTRQTYDF